MEEVTWTTRSRWLMEYSADSVEWCPIQPYHHVLVCATYQLDKTDSTASDQPKSKQNRLGRIYLFSVNQIGDLKLLQTLDSSGILDQKWCYHSIDDHPVLAVVTACGKLVLFHLTQNEDKGLHLEFWIDYLISDNVLALSLDWSTNKIKSEHRIAISDSSGAITVLKLDKDRLIKLGEWKSHGFEAWIAAFDYWNPDIFYSGGDDCVFKSYDIRIPVSALAINRTHEAGVTSIRSHVDVEHQLLTGSYDENIRLWDRRSLKQCLTQTNVNGGVWRIKWHPSKPDAILAACMYGGFRLLKLEDKLKVICEYMEHESIAYGADWQWMESPLVATCSFYDCKLHISKILL